MEFIELKESGRGEVYVNLRHVRFMRPDPDLAHTQLVVGDACLHVDQHPVDILCKCFKRVESEVTE